MHVFKFINYGISIFYEDCWVNLQLLINAKYGIKIIKCPTKMKMQHSFVLAYVC